MQLVVVLWQVPAASHIAAEVLTPFAQD